VTAVAASDEILDRVGIGHAIGDQVTPGSGGMVGHPRHIPTIDATR
jgi:hypothetical protein